MFYVYDGSFEGFLSAAAALFRSEESGQAGPPGLSGICRESDVRPLFPWVYAGCTEGILDSFGSYLSRHFSESMPDCVYKAFLSETPGIEDAILAYIRLARKLRRDPIDMLQVDCVREVAGAAKRTGRETHKLTGLLRFRKLTVSKPSTRQDEGASLIMPCDTQEMFYAECEPETNCIALLADHFSDRFAGCPFIIGDRKRFRCLVHVSRGAWTIAETGPDFFQSLTADTLYEDLWRMYFKKLAIPERINPKLQAANMPKKYWKHLVEKPSDR